jgi:hypothetical protein
VGVGDFTHLPGSHLPVGLTQSRTTSCHLLCSQRQCSRPAQRHGNELEERARIHREHHQRGIRRERKCDCYKCSSRLRRVNSQRSNKGEMQPRALRKNTFSMEHELYKSIDITHPVTGEHNNTLILAHVKYIHTRKDVVTERCYRSYKVQTCRTFGR